MASANKTLLVIGAGPGIGRAVATMFASKRHDNIVLVARRAEQLKAEQSAVEAALSSSGKAGKVKIKTYAVDITHTAALLRALDDADAAFGKPECVFFNAARVLPSTLMEHDVEEIEYDLKITVSALYIVAQRYMPHLLELATSYPNKPGLIVTSSALPFEPIPELFALSLTKAAQFNLMRSMHMTYAPRGVHVGVINVGGMVSEDHERFNPANIADKTWEWYADAQPEVNRFELVI